MELITELIFVCVNHECYTSEQLNRRQRWC